jgi:hypothetical protein
MTRQHVFALFGFLFVGAWIEWGFGEAILCGLGAVLAYFAAGFLEGGVDLGELQSRVQSATGQGGGVGSSPGMRTRVR